MSTTEAEDLVQDALIRAFRSIDTFDGKYPRAWLLTIVRTTNINRHRRQRLVLLDDPDVLEIPIGTVMSRLHRARRKVRDDLCDSGLAPRRFR